MSFSNHSVSDLITIIRNGYLAKRKTVKSVSSKLRVNILKILKDEGYISDYIKSKDGKFDKIDIYLKYVSSAPSISEIITISKPGRRVYCNSSDIPVVKNGLGMPIISTSKGLMPGYLAKENKLGGEILFNIF